MKINDLLTKYTFHDSLIENIIYDAEKKNLILTIDFCLWMQEDYIESQPETAIIKLVFSNVTDFEGVSGKVDSFSILKISYIDNVITISILDDFNEGYHEIVFKTDNVEMQ